MPRTRAALTLLLVLTGSCVAPAVDRGSVRPVSVPRRASHAPDQRPVAAPAEVRDLVARINRHRRSIGCGELRWDDRLAAVALRHSQDMARRGFFSHTNPDGRDPFERMRRAGIHYLAAGENLASGQRTGEETFEGWMESRGHRENLENCVYTRIGIGLHRGRWTCELARLESDGRPSGRTPG